MNSGEVVDDAEAASARERSRVCKRRIIGVLLMLPITALMMYLFTQLLMNLWRVDIGRVLLIASSVMLALVFVLYLCRTSLRYMDGDDDHPWKL